MCDLSWLYRDMDEAPSWKIFPKAHAAPRRGCWCSLAAIWSQMWDQVPGKEPGTQTGAGHNAGSSSSKGSSRHNSQTRNFSSRMSKYFALQRQKKKCILHGDLPELYISWETLATQTFHFWWKQKSNDCCFSGSESLIFYCLLSSSLRVPTSKRAGKCFCSHVFLSLMLHHCL